MSISPDTKLSRGDVTGIVAFVAAGVVIAVGVGVRAVARIVELVRGTDVPVGIEFAHGTAEVPLTDGSGAVPIALDSGVLVAPRLTAIAIAPGVIGQIALILTVLTVVGCLVLLSRRIIGGRVFGRANTALVSTAGITGLIGFAAVRFFDNMLANATVSLVTDNRLDNAVLTVEPFTFVLAAFVVAVISTAFAVGARLQRETEGLV
ncbi:hypothetical protein [Microbacterium sp. 179-I 3D4 NHS]|uniref:hypothetical protein n=1 Tax=Microbacterium sp. 179-I 3D4 NHS TaxID=3142381 RepID=UPI0039A06EE6